MGLDTLKQNFQKVPEQQPWPGPLAPAGLSATLCYLF